MAFISAGTTATICVKLVTLQRHKEYHESLEKRIGRGDQGGQHMPCSLGSLVFHESDMKVWSPAWLRLAGSVRKGIRRQPHGSFLLAACDINLGISEGAYPGDLQWEECCNHDDEALAMAVLHYGPIDRDMDLASAECDSALSSSMAMEYIFCHP
jgi:hypothetical protein